MIIFKKTLDKDNPHIIAEVEFTLPYDASLGDLVEEFQNFLKACGFAFEGELDFIDEDEEGGNAGV